MGSQIHIFCEEKNIPVLKDVFVGRNTVCNVKQNAKKETRNKYVDEYL
jgi:hypothetical protein